MADVILTSKDFTKIRAWFSLIKEGVKQIEDVSEENKVETVKVEAYRVEILKLLEQFVMQ